MVKKGLTTTGKAREIGGWARYRPFAQEQNGDYVSNFYHDCMQDHFYEFFTPLLLKIYLSHLYACAWKPTPHANSRRPCEVFAVAPAGQPTQSHGFHHRARCICLPGLAMVRRQFARCRRGQTCAPRFPVALLSKKSINSGGTLAGCGPKLTSLLTPSVERMGPQFWVVSSS